MTAPHNDLLTAMRMLHNALTRFDARAAQQLGVGRNDAACLRLLVDIGPTSPSAIMQALSLTSGSVTALIDRLEDRGFALRKADRADRRALLVEVTPAGSDAMAQAYATLDALTQRLGERLGAERKGAVTRQLGDLARLADWAGERSTDGKV